MVWTPTKRNICMNCPPLTLEEDNDNTDSIHSYEETQESETTASFY